MPTIAAFSDVHANLPALESVLQDIDDRAPDMVFCLGDLVGYAPWPNEVCELIRARRIPTIAGNYDEGVGLNSDDCGCAYKTLEEESLGARSIAFTNATISDGNRAYLHGLPRHMRLTVQAPRDKNAASIEILMVHGSPRKINQYLFADFPEAGLLKMMEQAGADVMLFGHTHKPYHKAIPYERDGATHFRHAINIGSVGKPKDGDPRAGYVVLQVPADASTTVADSIDVQFMRVPYDVERAANAVEASELPDAFANMLRNGH